MDVRKHVGSKWLRANDLSKDIDTVFTINNVILDEVEDEETGSTEELVTVQFEEMARKQLGLNVSNARTLQELFGWESDDWKGKQITLYVDPDVRMKGKVVGGIRIRPRKVTRKPRRSKRGTQSK
jgi:hypothetical protein